MCRTACILSHEERRIVVDGVEWRFDWHDYLGPHVLGKRGNPLSREPVRVLEAISHWHQQGFRRAPDGLCLWDAPPDPFEGFVRVGNTRHFVRHDSPLLAKFNQLASPEGGNGK